MEIYIHIKSAICKLENQENGAQSKAEGLKTKKADGVNPSPRAGNNEMIHPSSTSEAGKKGANSSFHHLLFYSGLRWIR